MSEKTENTSVKTVRKLKFKFKVILFLAFVVIYSFFIGTKGIFIIDYPVKDKNINNDLNGVKILQFSDIHYGYGKNKSDVKKIIKKINDAKADIVIFSGDLISNKYSINSDEEKFLSNELSKIKATYGKYFISGEEDFENAKNIFKNSNFINLNDSNEIIYINKSSILLSGGKDLDNFFKDNTDNLPNYKMLVLHDPNDIDSFLKYNFEMAMAGHTHNGQINIPKLNELFIKGKYKNDYQKVNNTKLFINPGIGNKVIKARLFNHPTIFLYRLEKTSN